MYPRTEYEMTEADLEKLLNACKSTPLIMLNIPGMNRSPQERANAAWAELGGRMGFDSETVKPIPGRGQRFFSAVPSETAEQRQIRLNREAAEKRAADITELRKRIEELQEQLKELVGSGEC